MTSPDDQLRALHASRSARDREMLGRIADRHRGGPEPDQGGAQLPDAATMLAAAVAAMEGDEHVD